MSKKKSSLSLKSLKYISSIVIIITFVWTVNFHSCKKNASEARKAELELNQYEPKIEISFADIDGGSFDNNPNNIDSLIKTEPSIADFPISDNDILYLNDSSLNSSGKNGLEKHMVYLVLKNSGKVGATDITLRLNTCSLDHSLVISGNMVGEDDQDYEKNILSAAISQKKLIHKISINLDSGKGLLIPIMIAEVEPRYKTSSEKWAIISKVVYIPESITYKSMGSGEVRTDTIRKMVPPIRISNKLDTRG